MKLAISNIAWAQEHDKAIFTHMAGCGYSGLEIAPGRLIPDNPYVQTDLAKKIGRSYAELYGLTICSMQAILFGRTEQLFVSPAERMVILKQAKKAVDFAVALSCPNLVFGAPKNRVIRDKSQYQIAVDFFYELGEYARQRDTVMAIEANPVIYGTNFINKTEEAFKLAQDVGSSGFMVNLDLGTIIYNREKPQRFLSNISCINHIHISEPHLSPLKKRALHKVFFRELKQGGYQKYLSIEMKDPGDLEVVKRALDYIRSVSDAVS